MTTLILLLSLVLFDARSSVQLTEQTIRPPRRHVERQMLVVRPPRRHLIDGRCIIYKPKKVR